MNKNFFISQSSVNDCGAACLAMMLNLFGNKVCLDEIKNKLLPEEDGVSAYDIIKLSSKYGIDAKGYKNCDIETTNLPAIAHVVNENGLQHFVVLLKVLNDKVLVADPASNVGFIKKEEFKKRYTGIMILFKNVVDKTIFKDELNKALKIIFLTIFLSIITVVSSYLLTNALKFFSDYNSTYKVIRILILFFIISIIREVISFIRQRLALNFETSIDKKITINTLKKLVNLPHDFYNRNGSGELISKINDLSYVKQMIYTIVESLSINAIFIICILIMLLIISKYLFIINLLIIILFYVINKIFLKKHFYDTYSLQMKNEVLNGQIGDCVNGILTIKNLSKEQYFNSNFEAQYNSFLSMNKSLTKVYQNKNLIISILTLMFNVIVFLILLFLKTPIYNVIFIVSIEDIVINSTCEFCKTQLLYANFKSAVKRLKSLESIEDVSYNSLLKVKDILFRNLNYSKNGVSILNNVNFGISSGEWIMVNGKTGSGKSTLFKLLTKQILCDKSGIYINGKSINDYSSSEIRSEITYVDQKSRLFNKSISDNIYFDGKITDNKIERFLKNHKIDKNIIINNTNSNISGGQMQKIIIAQTLINSGNVIIFDETTNQIDVEDEREILKFIKKEYKNKTIILIGHRNNNSFLFDKVINFKNGKVKITKQGGNKWRILQIKN